MIRAAIFLTLALGGLSIADAAEYCAKYNDGTQNCGIPTFESCQQSVSGVGGECVIDDSGEIPKNLMQRLLEAQPPPSASFQKSDPMPPPPSQ
jgi:hypothetical protein